MKVKGFGKNYFSLAAIQATVTAVELHAKEYACDAFVHRRHEACEDSFKLDDDTSPPTDSLAKEYDSRLGAISFRFPRFLPLTTSFFISRNCL